MKDVPAKSAARRKTRMSMDDPDHGVLVTIIDLGLARMDAHDGTAAGVHWTPFDEEVFEGEGDYQFDVYRMMRTHNGDAWAEFRPLTNVMVSLSHLRFIACSSLTVCAVAALPRAEAHAVEAPPSARCGAEEHGGAACLVFQRARVLRLP